MFQIKLLFTRNRVTNLNEVVELQLDGDDEEGFVILIRHGRINPVGVRERILRAPAGFLDVRGCGSVRDDIAEGS